MNYGYVDPRGVLGTFVTHWQSLVGFVLERRVQRAQRAETMRTAIVPIIFRFSDLWNQDLRKRKGTLWSEALVCIH